MKNLHKRMELTNAMLNVSLKMNDVLWLEDGQFAQLVAEHAKLKRQYDELLAEDEQEASEVPAMVKEILITLHKIELATRAVKGESSLHLANYFQAEYCYFDARYVAKVTKTQVAEWYEKSLG